MILSKLWFILVALAASVALTVAFVAPRSAGRQLDSTESMGLDRAQYAAEQMLKNDARRWMDYVSKIGRDAQISEALDSASRGAGEPRMLHETVRNRLGGLAPDPAAIGIHVLAAVDASGKIVARIGDKENDYGESVAGIEIVDDALSGYLNDSAWGSDGRLTRVAAAPVLSKANDRIIGAIYVGIETGDRLADIWKRNLRVDVAFVLGDEIVTSTIPQGALGALPGAVADRFDEIRTSRRTTAFPLPLGADQLRAVAAPFTGEAEAMGGYYVLLQKSKAVDGPFTLLMSTTSDDLGWGVFPWIPIIACVLTMLVVGLLLQRIEVEQPFKRLRTEAKRLALGEIPKLDDAAHRGRFGGIARDVNSALERLLHGDGHQSPHARKDINQILGEGGGRERAASLPPLPPLGGSGWGSGSSSTSSPALGFSSAGTPGGAPAGFGGMGQLGMGQLGMGQQPGALPSARLSSPPMPSGPPQGAPGLPIPPARPPGPPLPMAAPPAPMAAPPAARPPLDTGATMKVPMDDSPTHDVTKDPDQVASEWEEHVRAVFAEYIETRARCGEANQGMTLDKFRQKLDGNRNSIMQKYSSRSARFSVYVKDGKAAIKAAPLK